MSENKPKSKCEICWKSFIWACPIGAENPKNIVSCSAYEPTDVYLKERELISKFRKEKKELERNLRKKWKNLGNYVHIEKKNHINSLNNTYQGYLMAIHIWKMYRVDYYSKRSRRN